VAAGVGTVGGAAVPVQPAMRRTSGITVRRERRTPPSLPDGTVHPRRLVRRPHPACAPGWRRALTMLAVTSHGFAS